MVARGGVRTEGVGGHSIVGDVEPQVSVEEQRDGVLFGHGAVHRDCDRLDGEVATGQVGAHLVVERVCYLNAWQQQHVSVGNAMLLLLRHLDAAL